MERVYVECGLQQQKTMISRGMTLIEVALAVTIGLVVVAFAVGIYGLVSGNQQTAEAQRHISLIKSNVRQLYSERSSYSGMKEETLIDAGAIPEIMIAGPTDIRNTWNGTVEVNPAATDPSEFVIIYEDVPEAACIDIASGDGNEWTGITVEGVSVDGTVMQAETNCGGNGSRLQLQGY